MHCWRKAIEEMQKALQPQWLQGLFVVYVEARAGVEPTYSDLQSGA